MKPAQFHNALVSIVDAYGAVIIDLDQQVQSLTAQCTFAGTQLKNANDDANILREQTVELRKLLEEKEALEKDLRDARTKLVSALQP